jgi:hypothetical protein
MYLLIITSGLARISLQPSHSVMMFPLVVGVSFNASQTDYDGLATSGAEQIGTSTSEIVHLVNLTGGYYNNVAGSINIDYYPLSGNTCAPPPPIDISTNGPGKICQEDDSTNGVQIVPGSYAQYLFDYSTSPDATMFTFNASADNFYYGLSTTAGQSGSVVNLILSNTGSNVYNVSGSVNVNSFPLPGGSCT